MLQTLQILCQAARRQGSLHGIYKVKLRYGHEARCFPLTVLRAGFHAIASLEFWGCVNFQPTRSTKVNAAEGVTQLRS